MATELGPLGIRVNSISPGVHRTDRLVNNMLALAKETLRERTIFGLTERFHDSVTLINAQLIHYFPRTLAGVRLGSPPFTTKNNRWAISERAHAIVKNLSAADVALYSYARARFAMMWKRALIKGVGR